MNKEMMYKVRGYRNRKIGHDWEEHFDTEARRQGITVVEMPLGCERVGKHIKQIKTLFDRVLISNGRSVYIDLKYTSGENFPYSQLTRHQVDGLWEIFRSGCQAGYVVAFSEFDSVIFFPASILFSLKPRESLTVHNGEYLGSINCFAIGNLFN